MILNADARALPIADKTVQCCITSPPYYGLRDYGTAKWEGGNLDCDHIAGMDKPRSSRPLGDFHGGDDIFHATPYKTICGKCGAIRIDSQIGLEQTPEQYVSNLVAVFREVWRVMKDDGTLWVNIGDSYAGSGKGGQSEEKRSANWQPDYPHGIDPSKRKASRWGGGNLPATEGLKPKDLIGIPWMVAFALRADGWYLRSDIIWSKPNPMPESVTDRPTKAHEYLFLLTKNARCYYDADAIKTPTKGNEHDKHARTGRKRFPTDKVSGIRGPGYYPMANARSVWTINTQPTSYAHFATFPEKLVEPCILAESRPGDLIFDPFAGSGTTGRVAIRHNRKFIGTELNFQYIADIAPIRLTVQPFMVGVA